MTTVKLTLLMILLSSLSLCSSSSDPEDTDKQARYSELVTGVANRLCTRRWQQHFMEKNADGNP